jgi:hypothetical protein
MTTEHFPTDERYPDGCDWHKPPGCHCRLLLQRAACYEGCDEVQRLPWHKREASGFVTVVTLALVFFTCMVGAALLKGGGW